jgi:hypothetical protein
MKTLSKFVILALVFAAVFVGSCKKKSSDDSTPVVPDGEVTTTNLVISPDVFVITDSMELVSGGNYLSQGIYKYKCTGSVPHISENAVIVDSLNGGYIRKVTSTSVSGLYITLNTTQALLSDVFEEGGLSFTLDPGPSGLKSTNGEKTIVYREVEEKYSPGVTSSNKVDYEFNSEVAADLTMKGSFRTEPKIHFDFVFSKTKGVQKFTCSLDQTKLILQSDLELNVSGSANYSIGYELCKIQRRAIFWVYGVPVVVDMEFLMKAMGYMNFNESANFPLTYTNTSTLGYGITFENGQTTMNTGFSNESKLSGTPSFTANGQVRLDVIPQITVQFYKVLSNVITPKPYIDMTAQYTNVGGTQQMCAEVVGGIDLGMGINAALFGDTLFNITKDFSLLKETLWKSLEGCDIPKVTLSDATFGTGTNTCEPNSNPYAINMKVEDPGALVGPGTVLYAIYKFHVPGETGNSGTISRQWDAMTLQNNTLSYNICIHWEKADYVEQNVYLKTADGIQSNVVSVIIPGGMLKSWQPATGIPVIL